MKKILAIIIVVAVVAAGIYVAVSLYDPETKPFYTLISDREKQEAMEGVAAEVTDVLLGEAREQSKLVVFERDVSASQVWDDTWFDWEIFKKTKCINAYGTGKYTVDFGSFTNSNIKVDENKLTVTVYIPSVTLDSVELDYDKTQFQDTQNGLLRFSDLKVTPEQSNIMTATCVDAMKKELTSDSETLQIANDTARTKVKELFEPLVKSINNDYELDVVIR